MYLLCSVLSSVDFVLASVCIIWKKQKRSLFCWNLGSPKTCECITDLWFRTTTAEGRHDFPQLSARTVFRPPFIVDLVRCTIMMSNTVGRRVLAQSKSFLSLRTASRKPSVQAFRRGMASDAHGAKSSSDMPWIVRGYVWVFHCIQLF